MKKFFILAITLISIVLFPSTVLASEHKVKAVILVPANKRNLLPQDQEEKVKSAVQQAFKRVQKFYADNLFGKTFNFDNNVEIIHSSKNISDNLLEYGLDFIWELDALQYLPAKSNTIYVVWTVGGRATRPAAFPPGGVKGYDGIVGLDSSELFQLDGPDDLIKQRRLGTLAHELGHTFGLVNEGYAQWHPCTIGTTHECRGKAPQPLPDLSEYQDDVMGYNHEHFPDFTIHNSIHNPIVSKAFQSAYLNPTKDPAPKPQASVSPPKIQSFFPEVAIAEETVVELRGTNFGNNQGEVILISVENKAEKVKAQNINNWSDSTIKFSVPKEAAKYPGLATIWSIQVIKSPDSYSSLGTAQRVFLVKNKPDPSSQLPPISLSARLHITCGPNQQSLPNVKVSLVEGQTLSKILKEATTDETGQATIEHTITKATVQSEFNILVEQLSGIPPAIPRTHKISLDNNQAQLSDLNFSFNFPECPKDKSGLDKEDKIENKAVTYGTEEVEIVTEVVSVSPSNSEITEITISNYQDFRGVNDQGDKGSTTQSEQYQPNNKINWTASTLTTDPKVYVQIIYPNKEPENYSIEVDTESTVSQIGEMELRIKRVLPKETSQRQEEQQTQDTQTRQITKIYLASVSGDYLADLYNNGEYFDPDIDITEVNNQFKIIRCYSDLSCDDPNLAKVVNLAVEASKAEEQPIQEESTKEALPPQQPVFSHRTCGDVSGNVIVDVYSDGSEVPVTNCEDLDKVCKLFDNEARQDATCVDKSNQ